MLILVKTFVKNVQIAYHLREEKGLFTWVTERIYLPGYSRTTALSKRLIQDAEIGMQDID